MRRSLILLLTLLASCAAPPPPAPFDAAQGKPPADPGAGKREVAALLGTLEKNFYLHWGSVESTAEYRKFRDEHVPVLRAIADSNGENALMALRVLAKRAPSETFKPEAKAILYWTVFERDTLFNRWGVITKSGFLPGVYGQEVLSLGPAVAPYFQRSLRDRRRADVFGTEDARTSRLQGDRVCDYAWVLLATIFDRPLAYHEDPRLRDPQIQELDVWVNRLKK